MDPPFTVTGICFSNATDSAGRLIPPMNDGTDGWHHKIMGHGETLSADTWMRQYLEHPDMEVSFDVLRNLRIVQMTHYKVADRSQKREFIVAILHSTPTQAAATAKTEQYFYLRYERRLSFGPLELSDRKETNRQDLLAYEAAFCRANLEQLIRTDLAEERGAMPAVRQSGFALARHMSKTGGGWVPAPVKAATLIGPSYKSSDHDCATWFDARPGSKTDTLTPMGPVEMFGLMKAVQGGEVLPLRQLTFDPANLPTLISLGAILEQHSIHSRHVKLPSTMTFWFAGSTFDTMASLYNICPKEYFHDDRLAELGYLDISSTYRLIAEMKVMAVAQDVDPIAVISFVKDIERAGSTLVGNALMFFNDRNEDEEEVNRKIEEQLELMPDTLHLVQAVRGRIRTAIKGISERFNDQTKRIAGALNHEIGQLTEEVRDLRARNDRLTDIQTAVLHKDLQASRAKEAEFHALLEQIGSLKSIQARLKHKLTPDAVAQVEAIEAEVTAAYRARSAQVALALSTVSDDGTKPQFPSQAADQKKKAEEDAELQDMHENEARSVERLLAMAESPEDDWDALPLLPESLDEDGGAMLSPSPHRLTEDLLALHLQSSFQDEEDKQDEEPSEEDKQDEESSEEDKQDEEPSEEDKRDEESSSSSSSEEDELEAMAEEAMMISCRSHGVPYVPSRRRYRHLAIY